MTRKRGMATAFAAACLVLAGCAGPLNLMQESIYCDDARIAQGFDTYTVANRTGSLFDRKIGGYALKAVGAHASAEIAFELQASEGVTAVATGDAFDDDQAVDLEPIES